MPVRLTKVQVKASPDVLLDRPVSRQNEFNLYDYYNCDPLWGGSFLGANAPPLAAAEHAVAEAGVLSDLEGNDPHLRSLSAVTGYDIRASDGAIGHLENTLLEDKGWDIRYLIIDTRNWWAGKHVLVSPHAVLEISWSKHLIYLNVSREKVKASPPWAPLDLIDEAYERRLHSHYDWPGYGW
jgi:hypothetical protein